MEDSHSERQIERIARILLDIARDRTVRSKLPGLDRTVTDLEAAAEKTHPLAMESAVIRLYLLLHGAGNRYTHSERKFLDQNRGYSCIAGGLFPLLKAEDYIRTESVVADLGAGNGLQGLLLQCLYPHKKTLQVELSSEMICMGRMFQDALCIPSDRITWINDDIVNAELESVDFVYIYRPARPSDNGRELYRTIALKLAAVSKPLVVFSVADCLSEFLDKSFSVFYTDGHLTCFSRKPVAPSGRDRSR